jgi:hypothetical protein
MVNDLVPGITLQLQVVAGATAFVLTSLHVVLSFPLLSSLILRNRFAGKRMLMLFFITGILMHAAWLIYLWCMNNLFIKTALGLQVLSYTVFLVQALAFHRYANHKTSGKN